MKYRVVRQDRLITVSVPEGATDDTLDGASLFEQLEVHLADRSGGPFVVLHDLRGTPRSPIRRKRFADWVTSNEALIQERIARYAVVASSALQKGMITAVLWAISPPIPWRAFTDVEDARRWLLADAPP